MVLVKGQMDSGRTCEDLDQSGRPKANTRDTEASGVKIQGADKRCARALVSHLRSRTRERLTSICCDDYNRDVSPVAAYLADFFNQIVKHQGRTMKRRDCALGRMCVLKLCKEYNHLAVKHAALAGKYNELVDKYNELKHQTQPKEGK